MPKTTFTDQENIIYELIPDGDYIVEVIKSEAAISNKPKTSGCDVIEVQLRVDTHPNCRIWDDLVFGYEKLQWKIDCFLKSMNFLVDGHTPQKGEDLDITIENVIGLRGWVSIGHRDYFPTGADQKDPKNKKSVNEVKVYITNKPKLARRKIESSDVPAAAVENDPWA